MILQNYSELLSRCVHQHMMCCLCLSGWVSSRYQSWLLRSRSCRELYRSRTAKLRTSVTLSLTHTWPNSFKPLIPHIMIVFKLKSLIWSWIQIHKHTMLRSDGQSVFRLEIMTSQIPNESPFLQKYLINVKCVVNGISPQTAVIEWCPFVCDLCNITHLIIWSWCKTTEFPCKDSHCLCLVDLCVQSVTVLFAVMKLTPARLFLSAHFS